MDEATMQERYDATRVLVTGASGFIGTHLCKRLANLGAEVHGVSRREQSEKGVLWWRGDLADADDASRVVQGVRPDYVFNLASVVAGARDMAMVQPAFEGNLASAVHLMVAAAEAGVTRFVQMGSQEEPAHGDHAPPRLPVAGDVREEPGRAPRALVPDELKRVEAPDRKSDAQGKSVDLGGRRIRTNLAASMNSSRVS